MNLILNLISLIQVYTYNLIDTTIRILERPYYISNRIEDKTEILLSSRFLSVTFPFPLEILNSIFDEDTQK